MANPFVMYDNIVPIVSPQDITGTATSAPYMDLKNAQAAGFLIAIGNVDGTSTDTEVITVEACTAEGGTEVAQPFRYRLAGALGANTWGAVTTCASTGYSVAVGDDNKWLWIEIEPSELLADNQDMRYVRVRLVDTPDMANFLVCVVGFIQTRYKNATMITATGSASS